MITEKITNIQMEEFLKDFEKNSETSLLEEGKKKDEIVAIAKAKGINLKNNKDLAGFKTIYTFANQANKNRVRLPKMVLLKALPTMIGKPVDIDHNRRYVVGHYIDYRYIEKDDMVMAYGVFYKNAFADEWEKAQKLFKTKKLSTSYEIWCPQNKRRYLEDGTYELLEQEIAGGALLYNEEPAFDGAKVLELAKKNMEKEPQDLVYASKYKDDDIIVANENYFKKSVQENLNKLQEERKVKEQLKKEEPKQEEKVEEPKVEETPQTPRLKCSNCSEEFDYNGIDVEIKCPKCFALLNKEGVMQYPPQIFDFRVMCPSCRTSNWLLKAKAEKEVTLKCRGCAKEYKAEFVTENVSVKDNLKKFNFVYTGTVTCYQCGSSITINGFSNVEERIIKCPKCKLEFPYSVSSKRYKALSKITEIKTDKVEKSSVKGGQKSMDYEIEMSKYHRYVDVDNWEKFDGTFDKDYTEDCEIAKRLTYQEKKALPDNMFAVVVRVKNKRTGEMRKIRMFPINDEAHVRNALARLGQDAPQATLKRLGVSIESVKNKIMRRARQLKMKLAEAKKVEETKVIKQKPEKEVVATTSKIEHDLALYALEDKLAKYTKGIRKLASKVRSANKELDTVKASVEEKVNFYKDNAKKILERRTELGDFANDITDENIVNEKDYEIAKLKKQLAEKDAIETASEIVGDKENTYEANEVAKKIAAKAFPKN